MRPIGPRVRYFLQMDLVTSQNPEMEIALSPDASTWLAVQANEGNQAEASQFMFLGSAQFVRTRQASEGGGGLMNVGSKIEGDAGKEPVGRTLAVLEKSRAGRDNLVSPDSVRGNGQPDHMIWTQARRSALAGHFMHAKHWTKARCLLSGLFESHARTTSTPWGCHLAVDVTR